MQNVRQLITDTRKWKNYVGTDIERNSRDVMLYDWKVVEAMDVDNDIFRDVFVKARTRRGTEKDKKYGRVRRVSLRFYGEDQFNSKAWVSCSCEYFKYTAEVALYDKDSSDIKYSNGEDPVEKNPSKIPIVCKHILAALRAGAVKRPVTESLLKRQQEYEKKQKQEKERKLKEKEAAKKKALEKANKEREAAKKKAIENARKEKEAAKKKALDQARREKERARKT